MTGGSDAIRALGSRVPGAGAVDEESGADSHRSRRLGVLDGATGTGLMASRPDLDPRDGFERLVVDEPEIVRSLHADHLHAGCDLVRTNTFCGSDPELEAVGLGGRARALARRAAEIAREAIDASDRGLLRPLVLGVIGPGRRPPGDRSASLTELVDAERERAAGLAEGRVDAFLVETARDPLHVRAAVAAARAQTPDTPIFASFSVESDGRLATGTTMNEVADLARDLELELVALNCSNGPRSLDRPLHELRRAWRGPFGAWPNAGTPTTTPRPQRWPVDPGALAAWAVAAVDAYDLRIVGGCCGTTSAHVEAIVRALAARSGDRTG